MKSRRSTLALTALAASLVLFSGAAASAALPSQPDAVPAPKSASPLITVSATAEVQRKPEIAVVHLGVELREATASAASEKVGAAMDKVLKAINDLKAAGVQLQTSGVSLSPAYSYQQDNLRQLLGYDASSMLRIRVEDPKSIGRIIDAAISAGANRIDGISFEVKEALQPRQEATTLAAKAARDKADTLAAALGLKIKSVVTATTSGDSPRYWAMTANRRMSAAAEGMGMGEGIEPGLITFTAEATVTFAAE